MQATSAHRLLPDNDQSWRLFPEFRHRVFNFVDEHLPHTDPASVVYDVTTKWTSLPMTTGYWLALVGETPIAHMASWITESYGRPFLFIYQAECDEGHSLGVVQKVIFDEIDAWLGNLNALIPEGRPKIDRIEMATWRNADVWSRYFQSIGRTALKVRSVIEISLGSDVPKLVI